MNRYYAPNPKRNSNQGDPRKKTLLGKFSEIDASLKGAIVGGVMGLSIVSYLSSKPEYVNFSIDTFLSGDINTQSAKDGGIMVEKVGNAEISFIDDLFNETKNPLIDTKIRATLDRLLEKEMISSLGYHEFHENPNERLIKLYNNADISSDAVCTYINFSPFREKIEEVEELSGLEYFRALIGAESDFFPSEKSSAGAWGPAQLTYTGVKGLIDRIDLDRRILGAVIDIEKLEGATIEGPGDDLNDYDLEKYGFKEKKFQRLANSDGIDIEDIKYTILPRYIKMGMFFEDHEVDVMRAFFDPLYNIHVGGALDLSNYLELGNKQLLDLGRDEGGEKMLAYKERPWDFFKGRENLRAFDLLDSRAGYNCGISRIKKDLINAAKDGKYTLNDHIYYETWTHRNRIKNSISNFKELEKYGFLQKKSKNIASIN